MADQAELLDETETETDELALDAEVEIVLADEEVAEDGDPAPKRDSDLIKHLRQQIRERDEKLRAKDSPAAEIVVGERPTIEGCNYDEEAFDVEYQAWTGRKAKAAAVEAKKQAVIETQRVTWQQTVDGYAQKRTDLRIPDFAPAEKLVDDTLSGLQQTIVLKYATNPAAVVYALGKRPEKLEALAAIEDLTAFTVALTKFEGSIKMTPKKKGVEPDTVVRGSAPLSRQSGDKHLEKLEAEAEKTGDRTKVVAYKREQKAKAR